MANSEKYRLHQLVRAGAVDAIRALPLLAIEEVNRFDLRGSTPLMYAVTRDSRGAEIVQELLRRGARIDARSKEHSVARHALLAMALGGGDPAVIRCLIEAGVDIRYTAEHGYNALLSAVHGRDILHDSRLIDLLRLLVEHGVSLNGISRYQESGLRVLSHVGRFDAVRFLLDAGADATHLEWTPLMHAVAYGSLADVRSQLPGADLEQKDWWSRTAWLLAVQTGDVAKAEAIFEAGADTSARGRCEQPTLFYAIESGNPGMLQWLVDIGFNIEDTDKFETTALITAAERDSLKCVDILLRAGAEVDRKHNGGTALKSARSRATGLRLLGAGADPKEMSSECRRALIGLPPDSDVYLIEAAAEQFARARTRRFGIANPELIEEGFWKSMIRSGVTGYEATQWFGGPSSFDAGPVWCAQRFGQSITLLPDGRLVQIAGEHEDHYDPDFCIYNDVFVHEPDGGVRIFGYPESLFPPTDFHTATLVGSHIYVIGSLGYFGRRAYGTTPVFRLDLRDFHIDRVNAGGQPPGWIYGHRADLIDSHRIRITGGTLLTHAGQEEQTENQQAFVLDTASLRWSVPGEAESA